MSLVTLLGGARSGKSRLAVQLATATGAPVMHVATGEARDDEMTERIDVPIATHGPPAGRRPWRSRLRSRRPSRRFRQSTPRSSTASSSGSPRPRARRHAGRDRRERRAQRSRGRRPVGSRGRGVQRGGSRDRPHEPARPRAYRDLLGVVNRTWVEASAEAAFVVAVGRCRSCPATISSPAWSGSPVVEHDPRLAGLLDLEAADEAIRTAAVAEFLDRKTKPRRSPGRLDDLAAQIAAIRGLPGRGRCAPRSSSPPPTTASRRRA